MPGQGSCWPSKVHRWNRPRKSAPPFQLRASVWKPTPGSSHPAGTSMQWHLQSSNSGKARATACISVSATSAMTVKAPGAGSCSGLEHSFKHTVRSRIWHQRGAPDDLAAPLFIGSFGDLVLFDFAEILSVFQGLETRIPELEPQIIIADPAIIPEPHHIPTVGTNGIIAQKVFFPIVLIRRRGVECLQHAGRLVDNGKSECLSAGKRRCHHQGDGRPDHDLFHRYVAVVEGSANIKGNVTNHVF